MANTDAVHFFKYNNELVIVFVRDNTTRFFTQRELERALAQALNELPPDRTIAAAVTIAATLLRHLDIDGLPDIDSATWKASDLMIKE